MVRAAFLVEQDVPVGPAFGALVEVVDQRGAVALGVGERLQSRGVEALDGGLGQQQVLVGPGLVHRADVGMHRGPAGPGLVPVEAHAPCVARGVGILEDHPRALRHQVAVVVPDDDLAVAQAGLHHHRAQVVLEEVAFVLGTEDHRLPALRGHGLVLHRHAPDRNALLLVRPDEPREVARPRVGELGLELAALQQAAVGLHERGRAPRAREQREVAAGRGDRASQQRDAEGAVVGDGERVQRRVALLHVGVAGAAEVGAVDRGARQAVADALLRVVVRLQQPLLVLGRERGEHLGAGVGDGAADSQQRLVGLVRIDENRDLAFHRLPAGRQPRAAGERQALGRTGGRGVDVQRGAGGGGLCEADRAGDGGGNDGVHEVSGGGDAPEPGRLSWCAVVRMRHVNAVLKAVS